jgi:hypothetical protein
MVLFFLIVISTHTHIYIYEQAILTDNPFQNTKYTLGFFLKEVGSWLTHNNNDEAQIVQRSKSYEDLWYFGWNK